MTVEVATRPPPRRARAAAPTTSAAAAAASGSWPRPSATPARPRAPREARDRGAARAAMERHGYVADPADRHRRVPRPRDAQAAARRRRRRRRQDRARQGAGAAARHRADPPAVLRGARRQAPRSTSGTTRARSCACGWPSRRAGAPTRSRTSIFSRDYLLERPLLRAITRREGPPVLLIDEIDRADDGFEAFLLEVLSDFQVTIPELGTIRAEHVPHVVLTSNRSREIGDALRRRCLYLYIEHPTLEKEVRILRARVPGGRRARWPRRSAASCRRCARRRLAQDAGRGGDDRLGAGAPAPAPRAPRPRDGRGRPWAASSRTTTTSRARRRGDRGGLVAARARGGDGVTHGRRPASSHLARFAPRPARARRRRRPRATRWTAGGAHAGRSRRPRRGAPRAADGAQDPAARRRASFERAVRAAAGARDEGPRRRPRRASAAAGCRPGAAAARAAAGRPDGSRRRRASPGRATSRATARRRCCAASPSTSARPADLAGDGAPARAAGPAAGHAPQPAAGADARARRARPAAQLPARGRQRRRARVPGAPRRAPIEEPRARRPVRHQRLDGRAHPLPARVRARAPPRRAAHARSSPSTRRWCGSRRGCAPGRIDLALERLRRRGARLVGRHAHRRVPGRRSSTCYLDELVDGQTVVRHPERRPRPRRPRAARGRHARASGRGPGGSSGSTRWPATRATSRPPAPWRRRCRSSTASLPAHNLESLERLLPQLTA